MKLVDKVNLAVLLPVLIGGLAAFFIGVTFTRASLHEEAEAQSRLLLGIHAHAIEDFFGQNANALRVLSTSQILQEGDIDQILDQLHKWRARFADVEGLSYSVADGTTYATIGDPFSIADRPYYAAILRGESVAGYPLTSRASGRQVILFMEPIFDPAGDRIGVLAATVEMTHLVELIQGIRIGASGFAALRDADGRVISGSDNRDAGVELGRILSEPSSEPVPLVLAGEHYRVQCRAVTGRGWYLALVTKESEALAKVRQWNIAAGATLAIAALMAIVGSLALRRILVPPIQHLMGVQQRIAEGDVEARATLESDDELGQLALSFNDMANAVAAANRELRASEELFRSQFESGYIGMAIVSPEKYWLRVNRRLCEMFGYSKEELLEKTWADITHPNDVDFSIAQFDRVLQSKNDTYEMEKRFITKDGQTLEVHLTVACVRNADGKVRHFVASLLDITRRKRLEEERRRLSEILERTTDFVSTVALDGRIIYINSAGRRMVGWGETEPLAGRTIADLHPEWALLEILDSGISTACESGIWQGETALLARDGREIPASQVIIAHRTLSGKVTRLSTITRDISERKQYEEELRKRGDELAALNLLAQAVTKRQSLQDACDTAVSELARALDAILVLLFVREDERLMLKACGPEPLGGHPPTHRAGECLCGLALETGAPVYSLDISSDERCTLRECRNAGLLSFAAIPLSLGEEHIGVLGVGASSERDFRRNAELLETAADQLAVTIHNVHLYEESRAYAAQLQHAMAERETAQQELLRSEAEARQANLMLRNILDTIPVRLFWKDRDLKFLGCNSLFARDAGFAEPSEIIGKDDFDMEWKASAGKYQADDRALMKRQQPMLSFEETQATEDGSVRILRTSKTPLRDSAGSVVGVLGTYEDITEYREAENALERSRRQFQDIASNVPGVIFQFYAKPDGEIGLHYMSEKSEEVIGIRSDDPDAMEKITAGVYEEKREAFIASIEKVIANPGPWRFESRFRKPSGETIWVSSLSLPQQLRGELVFNGLLMDISDAKRAELRAEETLARVEQQKDILSRIAISPEVAAGAMEELAHKLTEVTGTTFDIGRVSIWFFNEAETRLECLDLYECASGMHSQRAALTETEFPEVFETVRSSRYIAAEDCFEDQRIAKYAEAYLRPERVASVLYAVIRASGSNLGVIALEYMEHQHRWESDEIAFACQLADQVALAFVNRERGRAEEALRESEEKFRTIFESSPHAVLIVDLEGRILDVNPAVCEADNLPREAMIGRMPSELPEVFQIQDQERRQELSRELWSEGYLRNEEVALVRPATGETRVVLLSSSLVTIAGQRRILTMMADVTESKRLEERLRQSQKMEAIGQLAGGVAHDFNNLLQAILGYAELSIEAVRPGEKPYSEIVEIRRAGQQAAALTRQLLAFSRRQALRLGRCDLNEVIEDIVKMVRRVIGEDIELAVVPGEDVAPVHGDRSQLEQILLNLCVNARDAMPEGGRLTIETRNFTLDEDYCAVHEGAEPGPHVLLSVSDSGCGMDLETQRQIFQPFFTTKEAGKGTGLGLATVYGIVRQHGGLVHVYSELGKGTRFNVYLPAMTEPAEEDQHEEEKEEPVRGGTETVLLAEDEPQVRVLAKRILERGGYQVIVAEDGEQALEAYDKRGGEVELLLLDVVMPNRGGISVLEEIRSRRADMKYLFVSGYSENAIGKDSLLDTGPHLLRKPYGATDLLRAVRQVLDK